MKVKELFEKSTSVVQRAGRLTRKEAEFKGGWYV